MPVQGWKIASLGALLLIACTPARPPDAGVSLTEAYSPVVKACALGVTATQIVDIEETPEGADIIFTTSPTHLQELRSRVADQAALHGPDAHAGAGHGGLHGVSQAHVLRLWDMPVLHAEEIDIVGGALLRVVASDGAHVDELRARVRERVAKLNARGCP